MKITDILGGFKTAILEADEKPRKKFSNKDIANAQDKYKEADKQVSKEQPKKDDSFNKQDPGANSATKGKYQKPATDTKRADSPDRKADMAPSGEKTIAKDGKGKGQEGGQAMRAANQKVKKGSADQDFDANKEKGRSAGTLAAKRSYGDGDNAAETASERWLDTIGTEDYDEVDHGKDDRPKFNNDTKDNVGHGLDDAQQGGEFTDQEAWDEEEAKKPGDQLPPHNPADVDQQLAADDSFQREIGKAMKKANDLWFDQQAAAKASAHRTTDAEKALAQQKKDAKANRPEPSPEVQKRMDDKAGLAAKNQAASDSLSREQKARANATGGQRGSLEVSDMKAQANQDEGGAVKGSGLTPYALKAQQGDKEALQKVFKNVSPMLMKVASKYSFGDEQKTADMYGEAKVALMTAVKTFDGERGAEFTTHLMNTLKGMVKDASYQDRGDIQVSKDSQQKIGQYQKLQKKWADQGVTGHQADREILVDLGLAKTPEDISPEAWAKLDKIKQDAVTRGNVSMTGAGAKGEDGEAGDADTADGISSEFTGDSAIGTQGGDDEIESISKELATASPEAVKAKFDELISMAGLDDDEADIIQLAFGIGHDDMLGDSDIMTATGMSTTKIRSITDEALYKMAAYIAQENATEVDDEYMNLRKIHKYREKAANTASQGRTTGDYVDGGEDKETLKARRSAKSKAAPGSKDSEKMKDWEKKEKGNLHKKEREDTAKQRDKEKQKREKKK